MNGKKIKIAMLANLKHSNQQLIKNEPDKQWGHSHRKLEFFVKRGKN